MTLKNVFVALSTIAISTSALASGDFKISGDFAGSIFHESGAGHNLLGTGANGTPTVNVGSTAVQGTPGNSDAFSVDLAEVNLEKAMGDSTIMLGIGYGRMINQISGITDKGSNTVRTTLNLTNAYFQHKFGDTGFSFKLGRFASFLGYETYNYMSNMNYTRAYSFSYTMPWFLTGLAGNYHMNDMVDIGLYLVNGSINSDSDENRSKHVGASVAITPMEGLKVKVNYLRGEDGPYLAVTSVTPPATLNATNVRHMTQTINGIVSYNMKNMDFAAQYVQKTMDGTNTMPGGTKATVQSISAYASYKMDNCGAGLRYENFNDKDGAVFLQADNKINAFTVSGWYNLDDNTVVKLDIASHKASKSGTYTKDNGSATDSMTNYGLGLMYRF